MNKTLFVIGMFTMVFASAVAFMALNIHLVNACPNKSGTTPSTSTTPNNVGPSATNNVNAILTPVPATQLTSGQPA